MRKDVLKTVMSAARRSRFLLVSSRYGCPIATLLFSPSLAADISFEYFAPHHRAAGIFMIWMIVNHLCGSWVRKTCNKVPMYRCTGGSGDIAWANRVLRNTTPL
jgi:hypothetical protein